MAKDSPMQSSIPSRNRQTVKTRAADFTDRYANSVEVRSSFSDFRFVFGEVDVDEEKVIIEERAKIVMSPQHAKMFLKIFTSHLQKYEAKFGWIPEPPVSEETQG
jgi:hypothetical protein